MSSPGARRAYTAVLATLGAVAGAGLVALVVCVVIWSLPRAAALRPPPPPPPAVASVLAALGSSSSSSSSSSSGFAASPPPPSAPPRTVFMSCTTMLDSRKQDNWAKLRAALDAMQAVHPPHELALLHTVLVVNEYAAQPLTPDWGTMVTARYPWVEFVQKNSAAAGQARSLNYILDRLAASGCPFWLQWEESWAPSRRFLAATVAAMDAPGFPSSPTLKVDQLDLSEAVGGPRFPPLTAHLLAYATEVSWPAAAAAATGPLFRLEVRPRDVPRDTLAQMAARRDKFPAVFQPWPLWTLRPSMNRATAVARIGVFDTHPAHWPILFEWDYAARFVRAGCVRAAWGFAPARRYPGHRSTYDPR